jgi:hypothetical protein
MQIPDPVRAALRACALTPAEWRHVQAAFAAVPEPAAPEPAAPPPPPPAPELLGDLEAAAEALRAAALCIDFAEGMRELLARAAAGTLRYDQLQAEVFRILWTIHSAEGARPFARRFDVSAQMVYRRLRECGIPLPKTLRPSAPRPVRPRAEIEAKIGRLQTRLANLQAEMQVAQ